ncbi:MAG: acetyl-CoA carboxylase carboxyltransferase subunit beta [Deltaproteobacteria bacterium]|nr:acetyl-CoA carboxylase carboxyltransferase subunit beta [Deltaproteobacteria bacterium]
MSWFKEAKLPRIKGKAQKSHVPEGLWLSCSRCHEMIYREDFEDHLHLCPHCHFHFRMNASQRLSMFVDVACFEELDPHLTSPNPLSFVDERPYEERLKLSVKKTGRSEAIITGIGKIGSVKTALGIFDFSFMGGSMGIVVGEKIARLFEKAICEKIPVVLISSSGGARMQEGVYSLMQMAKTLAALDRFRSIHKPYISVLTDPTTGGVAASFAMCGDIIIAEPETLIGFAGPRVIEQTIKQTLPTGFQRAEFLLEHGMIDMIVDRLDLKNKISKLLGLLTAV